MCQAQGRLGGKQLHDKSMSRLGMCKLQPMLRHPHNESRLILVIMIDIIVKLLFHG